TEHREGRGFDDPLGPHLKLKLDHLGREVLESRLPGVCDLAKTFAHVDPAEEPIPVIPTCHYMMGGIPTDVNGQALHVDADGNVKPIPGLFACGEDRKSTRLNSSHVKISYAVFCLKKKKRI